MIYMIYIYDIISIQIIDNLILQLDMYVLLFNITPQLGCTDIILSSNDMCRHIPFGRQRHAFSFYNIILIESLL